MGRINIDFSAVEEQDPLPAGTYTVRVESVKTAESKSSDHPLLEWKLRVTEPAEHERRVITMRTSLAPQALWKLKGLLSGLGINTDSKVAMETGDGTDDIVEPPLVGLNARARIRQREYEGRTYADVVDLVGLGSRSGGAVTVEGGNRRRAVT
jgi:hypothetical protein